MAKHVALLRGINVGGRIIKMAELKACFEELGFAGVTTLLQTGNVAFESESSQAELKPLIETALTEAFSYPAKAQVLSAEELRQIIEKYPFGGSGEGMHDYVIFVENGLESQMVREVLDLGPGEQVQRGNGVVYWRVEKGQTLKSSFAKVLTKAKYREFNTNRNLNTLKKLL